MRDFALYAFLPSNVLLLALAGFDKLSGDGALFRNVMLGLGCGLVAAVAYDVFRLPFVFSRDWSLAAVVPPLPLFKVFPRFGAMLLGQPIEQEHYSTAAQLLGWTYHFSNGATFGAMYMAMIGSAPRRSWMWGIALALGLELGMLVTPYPAVFGIAVSGAFLFATIAAHGIFGATLGVACKRIAERWQTASSPVVVTPM
jgi:hypothetical protein